MDRLPRNQQLVRTDGQVGRRKIGKRCLRRSLWGLHVEGNCTPPTAMSVREQRVERADLTLFTN